MLLGVVGEVSTHHPELVFQRREVPSLGRLAKEVYEWIPPYLASGKPLSIIGSAIPLLDNVLLGEYLL